MTSARSALAGALLAAALLATSCGAPLMKLPSGPGRPAPDAASLLDSAIAACRRVATISAEIGVSGSVGGKRIRGRLLAGLAAPASIYIEAPAPFGGPLFVIGGREDDATLLLPRDRRVLEHGRAETVLDAVAGVPLGPAELRTTLTGCPALTAPSGAGRDIEAIAYGDGWRVLQGDGSSYLRRERQDDPWRLVAVVSPGRDGWRADYRNFVNDLPTSIRLVSSEPRRFDLRLDLSQVEINVDLPESTFRVSIPQGAQAMTIDELRASGPLAR